MPENSRPENSRPGSSQLSLEPGLAASYAACADDLRAGDPDRWLAHLLAPEAARPHLAALYTFSLDTARVREVVSEPMLGEIRLAWWREVLEGGRGAEAEANPKARALLASLDRFRLPRQALIGLIEARRFDLYDDPMPDRTQLEGYCGETASILFRLASLILHEGTDPGGAEACGHAGVAYAVTGLLRALPWHSACGQCYLPRDMLAVHGLTPQDVAARRDTPALRAVLADMRALAREHLDKAQVREQPKVVREALRVTALVPLYLKAMERGDYAPFATLIEVPQWRRQWALWRGG